MPSGRPYSQPADPALPDLTRALPRPYPRGARCRKPPTHKELTMQSHSHIQSRPSLLAILAVALLALAVMAPNTLARQTAPPAAPSFPAAVPERPGALTGGHTG